MNIELTEDQKKAIYKQINKEKRKAYKEANPEKCKEAQIKWVSKQNKEEYLQYHRNQYKIRKEKKALALERAEILNNNLENAQI